MIANSKILKGYFLWSIPFLFFSCGMATTAEKKSVDPKNCEWYVVQNEKAEQNKNSHLGLYALRFYPDGNYSLCADLLFEQGKWNFDEQKKLLLLTPLGKDSNNEVRYLADQTLPGNQTQFSFYHGFPLDKSNPDEMIEVHAIANQSKLDPYNSTMHGWRIKPKQQETPDQIQQRVVAYLHFLLALYTHAKENQLENAGGNWYPQPVKFYSNKVSMAYSNELIDWYNCFFNEEQGIKAYQLIGGALMKVKIEGKDDVNRNINCTEQLLKQIEK
jgi:hypothetical protein